jgi:glucose/arabinose dehydrogenase
VDRTAGATFLDKVAMVLVSYEMVLVCSHLGSFLVFVMRWVMAVNFVSPKRSWAMTVGAVVSVHVTIGVVTAGPIPETISKTGLSVIVRDFVQMPSTGSSPHARINFLREEPGGADRLFVNDLRGYLYTVDKASQAVTTYIDFAATFPSLKTSPGLASGHVTFEFHPEFATNGKFYTVHSEDLHTSASGETAVIVPPLGNFDQSSVLIEWTATDSTSDVFSGTRREILRVGTPGRFHPMGDVGFRPAASPGDDDYGQLFISIGDGQSFNLGDSENLQRLDSYLGAILRIDPDPNSIGNSTLSSNGQYRIPNENPWAFDNDSDPNTFGELYAYGFRNPHRMSWDSVTETMFVTEIGENDVEEINIIRPGENYGWHLREGTFLVGGGALPAGDSGFTYPVAQYDHDEGSAIASGFVYRGDNIPSLQGAFVFGDVVNGRIFYSDVDEMIADDDGDPNTTAAIHELQLIHNGSNQDLIDIVSGAVGTTVGRTDLRLAVDSRGELYITTKQDGWIREILPRLSSDFDFDGDVDSDDLVQWEGDFGLNGDSDANGDGESSGADFLAWQRQFGSGVSALSASTAVPEPSCIVLLLAMMAMLCHRDVVVS